MARLNDANMHRPSLHSPVAVEYVLQTDLTHHIANEAQRGVALASYPVLKQPTKFCTYMLNSTLNRQHLLSNFIINMVRVP